MKTRWRGVILTETKASAHRLLALIILAGTGVARGRTPPDVPGKSGEGPAPGIPSGDYCVHFQAGAPLRGVTVQERFPMCRRLTVRFMLRFSGGGEGAGLVFLDEATHPGLETVPAKFAWQEPNLAKCFAVGLDISDPPSKNPFNAAGNIYRRPQHQVSLHWDGREVANTVAPVAFEDGKKHAVEVSMEYVAGGVLATVRLDGNPVYDRCFVIGPVPYAGTVAFGFSPKKDLPDGACDLQWEGVAAEQPVAAWPHPETIPVFEGVVLTPKHREHSAVVSLPEPGRPAQRISLSYTLGPPPGGIDPWDRVLSIYVWDGAGRRFEIVRGITPFGKSCTWHVDVTDYQALLRGKRKMGLSIDTWAKGWQVDVSLDYYWGRPQWEAFRVTPLWAGDWEYGNPENPLAAHFTPRRVVLAPNTTRAKVRVTVTGHGMHPNTANAAEFFPAWRTLAVNGHEYRNLLWRTDCWLNPCRPQGGTWKYDRAGWCPGALVRPWDVDITSLIPAGRALTVEYRPQQYINRNAGKGRASHLVEVHLIEYRRP